MGQHGNQGELEYDFIVAPGVDPGIIQLSFLGAEQIKLDAQGNLILHTSSGEVVQDAPVLYQELAGVRQSVPGQFVLLGGHQVGFEIGTYDHSRTLVIDPILSYSTYLGGSGSDRGNAIAVDSGGNAYITGSTYSANFPLTAGPLQNAKGGPALTDDVFVSKLNAEGTALVYSTYLGGTNSDAGNGIAVDTGGNAYVTGTTDSINFPVNAGAFQQNNTSFFSLGFVSKLNSTGSAIVYSTYLGGSGAGDRANRHDADRRLPNHPGCLSAEQGWFIRYLCVGPESQRFSAGVLDLPRGKQRRPALWHRSGRRWQCAHYRWDGFEQLSNHQCCATYIGRQLKHRRKSSVVTLTID